MEISKETLKKYINIAVTNCILREYSRRRKDKEGFSIGYKFQGDDAIAKVRVNGSDVLMLHLSDDSKKMGKGAYRVTFESYVGYDNTVVDELSEVEQLIDNALYINKSTWSELYKVKVFTKDDVNNLYDKVIESDEYDTLLYELKNEKKLNSLIRRIVNWKYKQEIPMEYYDDVDPYKVLLEVTLDEIKYKIND